jgi:hypothetical protein
MAKVQAKRAAGGSKKKAAKRPAAQPKRTPAARKAASKTAPARKATRPAAGPRKKPTPTRKAAVAKSSGRKQAPKTAARSAKRLQPRRGAPAPRKPSVKNAGVRAASAAKNVARTVVKTAAKTAVRALAKVAVAAPVVARAAQAAAARVVPAADKKRTRRSRPRVQSTGVAVANWFVQDKPRPSSFIPAPARAEAPSLVAAPPASSDRLIRPEDINEIPVRTVPVRVDLEQGGGRIFIAINPQEVNLRAGEGIEWDFRYLGGADVLVDEVTIEFDRPSPFGSATFRSHKPGSARPHRQMSGAATHAASGKRLQYTIRAINAFKTELAVSKPWINVLA